MSNDFGALTILAPKCQKCPKVETCDHKQLAHLGYIIPIEDIGISMVAQRGQWKEPQSARNSGFTDEKEI